MGKDERGSKRVDGWAEERVGERSDGGERVSSPSCRQCSREGPAAKCVQSEILQIATSPGVQSETPFETRVGVVRSSEVGVRQRKEPRTFRWIVPFPGPRRYSETKILAQNDLTAHETVCRARRPSDSGAQAL